MRTLSPAQQRVLAYLNRAEPTEETTIFLIAQTQPNHQTSIASATRTINTLVAARYVSERGMGRRRIYQITPVGRAVLEHQPPL